MIRRWSLVAAIVMFGLWAGAGTGFGQQDHADAIQEQDIESGRDEATSTLIDLLKSKGVITDEEAALLQKDAEAVPGDIPPKEPMAPEINTDEVVDSVARKIENRVKERVKGDIKTEMADSDEMWLDKIRVSVPEWTRRIRWNGDIRLRYEGIFFDPDNADFLDPSDPTQLMNSKEHRNRFRYRARLGLVAEVNHQVEAGFRIATGSTGNPISTNETAGDYFNKDDIVLDRAYVKIQPVPSLPETNFWGGRMPNPWFSTDLVWDSDVNFEGLALNVDFYATDWFRPMLTGGWFPIQEEEWYTDKYLSGAQAGFEIKPRKDLILTLGAAYYDYRHLRGQINDPLNPGETDWTAPLFLQKGNSLMDIDPEVGSIQTALVGDYTLMNATGTFDIALFHPVHVVLKGDYVENIGFDADEVARRLGEASWPEETVGYNAGIEVGHPKVRNFSEWNVAFNYRYLEADAVLDAFADSDFHMGGTNARGWMLNTQLGVTKNVWLAVKWSTSDEIEGPPLAIDTLQVDLNAKF